jgi:hypothetical protein
MKFLTPYSDLERKRFQPMKSTVETCRIKEHFTMSKKALCIGINDYPDVGSDLSGCVNDIFGRRPLQPEQLLCEL